MYRLLLRCKIHRSNGVAVRMSHDPNLLDAKTVTGLRNMGLSWLHLTSGNESAGWLGLSRFLSTIVPRFGIIRAARRALPRIQLPQFHRSRCLRTRVRQTCEIVTGRTLLSVRCARLFLWVGEVCVDLCCVVVHVIDHIHSGNHVVPSPSDIRQSE